MEVKIYSLPTCPYCQELKDLLKEINIKFIDINVGLPEHADEYNYIATLTKCDELPVVLVGHQLLVVDKSFRSIPEAVQITKKLYFS